MKTTKVFLIAIFSILSHLATAQTEITNSVYYLFWSGNSPNTYSFKDSLAVSSQTKDSTEFQVKLDGEKTLEHFLKLGDSIYWIREGQNHVLLYDYSLGEGDTFKLIDDTTTILLAVDSVISKPIYDGSMRKHWYLSVGFVTFTWIENLGEAFFGWNYFQYARYHTIVDVYRGAMGAICKGDSLIHWRRYMTGGPDPSCDFDYLDQFLEIDHLQQACGPKIYPNPANEILNIAIAGTEGAYRVYTSSGSLVLSGKINRIIDVSSLMNGTYYLELHSEVKVQRFRFIKTP